MIEIRQGVVNGASSGKIKIMEYAPYDDRITVCFDQVGEWAPGKHWVNLYFTISDMEELIEILKAGVDIAQGENE
jgi:hypothetical protein